MSDLQTSMGDDMILHWQMIVCLRDGAKEAAEQLKAMYPEEARNVTVALSRHQD